MKYNIKAILDFAGIKGTVKGDEFITGCIFHKSRGFGEDTHPSLFINLKKGIYNCWSCGASGNIIDFIVKADIIQQEHVFEFLQNFISLDSRISDINNVGRSVYNALNSTIEERSAVLENYRKIFHPYFIKRKIEQETFRAYDAGYNKRLKRIIFPVYDKQIELAGLVGRSIDDSYPRYLYTKNIIMRNVLFGMHLFENRNDTVILVEGILDQVYMWQCGYRNTLSTMISRIHADQINMLKELDVKNLILFFDNDNAGKRVTGDVLKLAIKRFNNITVVNDYFGYKDPQSMPSDLLRKAIKRAKLYIYFYQKGGTNNSVVPQI